MPRGSASRYADFSRLLTFHEPVLSTPTSQDYFKAEVKPSLGQRLVLVKFCRAFQVLLCTPWPWEWRAFSHQPFGVWPQAVHILWSMMEYKILVTLAQQGAILKCHSSYHQGILWVWPRLFLRQHLNSSPSAYSCFILPLLQIWGPEMHLYKYPTHRTPFQNLLPRETKLPQVAI